MDKLDKGIMKAQKTYIPSKNFTKNTMKKINHAQRKKKQRTLFKPFALTGAIFASVLVIASVLVGNLKTPTNPIATTVSPTASQSVVSAAQETANQISTDISALDKEVASYTPSYSDTALNDISQ